MFFLALQWGGNQYRWDSSTVIGLFVGATATFAVFLWWEHHCGDNALLPFSMLRMRIIYSASATMFFFMGVMLIPYYYLPIYFQAVKGDSPLMSGIHLLPAMVGQAIATMLTGTLSKCLLVNLCRSPLFASPLTDTQSTVQKIGYYLPNILTGTSLTTIAYGLYSTLSPVTSVGKWIGYQIIGGAGNGSAAPGVSATPYLT